MSYQYDHYLATHKKNVASGFQWIQKNLPELLEPSLVDPEEIKNLEWYCCFAHDNSKTEPDEYKAYDAYFYGGNRSFAVVKEFNKAWLLHIHRNPHHWQYWILTNDDPKQGEILIEMPRQYIIEMICDWWAFSWSEGNLTGIFTWYKEHKAYIRLHPMSRYMVETVLEKIKNKLGEMNYDKLERDL